MKLERIAYVLKIFPKISETFIAEELAELRRRGVQVRILSLEPPRREPRHDLVAGAGLEPITCYQPNNFLAALKAVLPPPIHAPLATEAPATAIEPATEQR